MATASPHATPQPTNNPDSPTPMSSACTTPDLSKYPDSQIPSSGASTVIRADHGLPPPALITALLPRKSSTPPSSPNVVKRRDGGSGDVSEIEGRSLAGAGNSPLRSPALQAPGNSPLRSPATDGQTNSPLRSPAIQAPANTPLRSPPDSHSNNPFRSMAGHAQKTKYSTSPPEEVYTNASVETTSAEEEDKGLGIKMGGGKDEKTEEFTGEGTVEPLKSLASRTGSVSSLKSSMKGPSNGKDGRESPVKKKSFGFDLGSQIDEQDEEPAHHGIRRTDTPMYRSVAATPAETPAGEKPSDAKGLQRKRSTGSRIGSAAQSGFQTPTRSVPGTPPTAHLRLDTELERRLKEKVKDAVRSTAIEEEDENTTASGTLLNVEQTGGGMSLQSISGTTLLNQTPPDRNDKNLEIDVDMDEALAMAVGLGAPVDVVSEALTEASTIAQKSKSVPVTRPATRPSTPPEFLAKNSFASAPVSMPTSGPTSRPRSLPVSVPISISATPSHHTPAPSSPKSVTPPGTPTELNMISVLRYLSALNPPQLPITTALSMRDPLQPDSFLISPSHLSAQALSHESLHRFSIPSGKLLSETDTLETIVRERKVNVAAALVHARIFGMRSEVNAICASQSRVIAAYSAVDWKDEIAEGTAGLCMLTAEACAFYNVCTSHKLY